MIASRLLSGERAPKNRDLRLRKSDKPENRIARDGRRVDRILAETRANGYGTGDPSFIGGAYGRQAPDGLAGIAVPLADQRASTV